MEEQFNYFLKNGLSEYDKEYLNTFDYVMILYKDNSFKPYFCNISYEYFIEYPNESKRYESAIDVLNEEINLTSSESGIIYKRENDKFNVIAIKNNSKRI